MNRSIKHSAVARITIKKIAADLNLSIAAVSAALGSRGTSKVSAKTAERVRAYAAQVNYQPSLMSKAMRSQRLSQVAILVESGGFEPDVRKPPIVVDVPAIFGLNDFLREREWQLNIIEDRGRRSGETPLPRYLRERFLDGVVVISTSEERNQILRKDFTRFSIPAVFLNAAGEYNCITVDDRGGISTATRHLLDLGHRNILYVGTDTLHESRVEREGGYREVMEAESLNAPIYHIEEGSEDDRFDYQRRTAANEKARHLFLEKSYFKQRPRGRVDRRF